MMVLKYYECDVTVDKLVKQVPKTEMNKSGGKLSCAHLSETFIGNPKSPNGLIDFEKSLVQDRFQALGQQAVVVEDAC